mgnify:CR=1 FL=1|jgi:tRNA/tmRNA/rRNA uracil-C5-methylase (TrmA/RlmC/RlmD family)
MNQHQKKAPAELKIGQTFPLTIKRLGINGEGVGYFKKKVVFVPGALPGEEVVAEATNVQPKFSEARVKKIRKRLNTASRRHARSTTSAAAVSFSIWHTPSSFAKNATSSFSLWNVIRDSMSKK